MIKVCNVSFLKNTGYPRTSDCFGTPCIYTYMFKIKVLLAICVLFPEAMSDLVICKLSHCSASVAGSMDMILLCEKVAKEDIQVRFFEERDGQLLWEGYGDFQPTHVHKQVSLNSHICHICKLLIVYIVIAVI